MAEETPRYSDHHKLTSLHRYYGWSLVLRNHFLAPLERAYRSGNYVNSTREWLDTIMAGENAALMSYWYAALYVVIEGWKELKLADERIDALIASEHTDRLRVHRNATCHYQQAILVEKWNRFEKVPGSVRWIHDLDREFGRYFMDKTEAFAHNVLDTIPEAKEMTEQFLAFLQQYEHPQESVAPSTATPDRPIRHNSGWNQREHEHSESDKDND